MIEVRRRVSATPAEVFAVLADGWMYAAWVVGASRIRSVDGEFPSVGTQIHHSVGAWPLLLHDTTRVLACEPPYRLMLRARGWPLGEADVELRLEELPDGETEVRMLEDASGGPASLLPMAVRRALIAPRNAETLQRLASIAEGRSRQPLW